MDLGEGNPPDGWSGTYVTAAQVAHFLQVHVRTVHRYAAEGRLTAHRIDGGRAMRFRRTEVEAFVRPRPDEGATS